MNTFCTIITANYLPYALTLYDSVLAIEPDISLHILVVDQDLQQSNCPIDYPNLHCYTLTDVCHSNDAKTIVQRYQQRLDPLRWSLKSVLMDYLLSQKGYTKVLYADCDLYFFGDYRFLFEQLNQEHILLSPHWRSANPYMDAKNFELNFSDGIYNGGLVGASTVGLPAIRWWMQACAYKCDWDAQRGLYVDQKYLDFLHSRFEGVGVIRHQGCNVANWNQIDCVRTQETDGTVRINHRWDIIFIHFTGSTIRGIDLGQDRLLQPFLKQYRKNLAKHGKQLAYTQPPTFGQRLYSKLQKILLPGL